MDKNNPVTIYFVRHGLVHNPKQVFYGRLPRFKLSDFGLRQAEGLGPFFSGKPVDGIFSSPLLRTRQTAQKIAAVKGISRIRQDADLLETYTPYDGRPVEELDRIDWEIYVHSRPPYEQPADILTRASRFIESVRKQYTGKHIVAVTHGDVILFLSLWANGYEITPEIKRKVERGQTGLQYPATASVTTLRWVNGNARPDFEYYPGIQPQ